MNIVPGTAIDFKEQSANAGHIDFSSNPGDYGAIVTQNTSGVFLVSYAPNRDEYLGLIRRAKDGGSLEHRMDKLEKQLYFSYSTWKRVCTLTSISSHVLQYHPALKVT